MCTSQGFTKDLEEEKIPRVTDEGWNSQKQLRTYVSGPVEKNKEKTLYPHPKLSLSLFLYSKVGVAG